MEQKMKKDKKLNKFQIAWKHVKTLKGLAYGEYYAQFTDSTIAFEKDEVIIDEAIDKTVAMPVIVDQDYKDREDVDGDFIVDKWNVFICPRCKKEITRSLEAFDEQDIQYCSHCGQKLISVCNNTSDVE
jgi:DNA-directed RNA polymerase subunit RPC12/RpoP